MELEDVFLGSVVENKALTELAGKHLSLGDIGLWFRSPDSREFKMCVITRPYDSGGCATKETFTFRKKGDQWEELLPCIVISGSRITNR